MERRAWVLILVLGAIWGASYLFIKIGLRDLSPGMVAWLRVLLAACVLVPLALRRGGMADLRGRLAVLLAVAFLQVAAPFVLIAAGEVQITSSLAGILVASTPLFTAVLAVWVADEERTSGIGLVGIGLGFVGVMLLLGIDLGGSGSELLGGAAVLLASLGYAAAALLARRRLSGLEPLPIAAGVMIASAILLAPIGLATAPESAPGIGPVAAIAALGVIGTGVAFAIFYALIGSVGAARTYIVTYLAPAFAVLYGALLLGERVSPATIAGLTLIVGGSWLAAGGLSVREEAPPGAAAELPVGDQAT